MLNLAQLAEGASDSLGARSRVAQVCPQDTDEHFPDELEESPAGLD